MRPLELVWPTQGLLPSFPCTIDLQEADWLCGAVGQHAVEAPGLPAQSAELLQD